MGAALASASALDVAQAAVAAEVVAAVARLRELEVRDKDPLFVRKPYDRSRVLSF